jgi:protein-disulfide isomerase
VIVSRQPKPRIVAPAGAAGDGTGIALGDGPVRIDAYIDFLCPFCRMFEQRCGPMLETMVADGLITMVYHPMGFLDGLSTTRYSSRAAAASGCASDGGMFRPYAVTLFANQPPEGGPGLSDDEFIKLGRGVGLGDDFAGCVRAHRYRDWVNYVTATALRHGVGATPTTLVNGVPVPANPNTLAAAVAAFNRSPSVR